jgi:hypothetical protein
MNKKQSPLPSGFAVLLLDDGRWCPVRISRMYGPPNSDEGGLHMMPLYQKGGSLHTFSRRSDAVERCQESANTDAYYDQLRWADLAYRQEYSPELRAHCRELIEELTRSAPVELDCYEGSAYVDVHIPPCWRCQCSRGQVMVHGKSLDEALFDAAELVYNEVMKPCRCMQQTATRRVS